MSAESAELARLRRVVAIERGDDSQVPEGWEKEHDIWKMSNGKYSALVRTHVDDDGRPCWLFFVRKKNFWETESIGRGGARFLLEAMEAVEEVIRKAKAGLPPHRRAQMDDGKTLVIESSRQRFLEAAREAPHNSGDEELIVEPSRLLAAEISRESIQETLERLFLRAPTPPPPEKNASKGRSRAPRDPEKAKRRRKFQRKSRKKNRRR